MHDTLASATPSAIDTERVGPAPAPAGIRVSAHVTRVMIPLHLLGVVAVIYLASHWRWSALLEIWLGWFVIGCIGVEVGLHREFAHRAVGIESRAMKWLLAWLGCMGGQWSPVYWAALHRGVHHRHPDGERDLHTPRKGIWHWGSMAVLALVLPLAWFCTLVVLPILLSVHQENVINVCCHIRALGYRNHDTRDDSVNIWPLGILFWGQGFHNNHHARADRSDFGERWFEFDSCRVVIPVLRWLDRRLGAS